jgi:hypothetical protein
VAQHVPASTIVVNEAIHVDLHALVTGAINATASLTPAQAAAIGTEPKGKIRVPISVTDETNTTPITGYMDMAWFPKTRLAQRSGAVPPTPS